MLNTNSLPFKQSSHQLVSEPRIFNWAKLAHGDRKYRNALEYFEKVDVTELSKEEQAEYISNQVIVISAVMSLTKPGRLFTKVQKYNSKYSSPAAYYLAHLSYVEGNYDQALEEFLELRMIRILKQSHLIILFKYIF
ncbi:MAG: hypothetical protein R2759_16300 [Bacteroidales bacterium]